MDNAGKVTMHVCMDGWMDVNYNTCVVKMHVYFLAVYSHVLNVSLRVYIDDVDTVIIEISSVKELSLRGNPLRL